VKQRGDASIERRLRLAARSSGRHSISGQGSWASPGNPGEILTQRTRQGAALQGWVRDGRGRDRGTNATASLTMGYAPFTFAGRSMIPPLKLPEQESLHSPLPITGQTMEPPSVVSSWIWQSVPCYA